MRGLIVAGGQDVNEELIFKYSENAYIVCADSGIRNFINLEILPDIVVGDLDSSDDKSKEYIKKNNIKLKRFNPIKDFTDTEAALELLLKKNLEEIVILGGIGSRMDHSLGNIFLLSKIPKNIKAKIVNENNEIYYVEEKKYNFIKDDFKYISVIALSDKIIYSTKGLFYEADNLAVKNNSLNGVSNEIIKKDCEIIIKSGKGFIIKSKD